MTSESTELSMRRRPRGLRIAAAVGLSVALIVFGIWYLTHPQDLPLSDRRVDASTPAGSPVFIGVFDVPRDFGREIDLSGVRVQATATTPVTITPRLCRSGSIGATRQPDPFCEELVGTDDVTLSSGDQIVLEIVGEGAGAVTIDPVRLAFSEGLQRGVKPAGSRALVTFLSR